MEEKDSEGSEGQETRTELKEEVKKGEVNKALNI